MGCTSSSVKYREVYEELCERVGLPLKETRARESAATSVRLRSNAFAEMGNDRDEATGKLRAVAAGAEKPYLTSPRPVLITQLLAYSKNNFGIVSVHPLSHYLCARGVEAVSTQEDAVRRADTLIREDFRPWLLFVCEVFHLLGVLQEQKALSKKTAKWLKKMEKKGVAITDDNEGPLAVSTPETQITAADLNPKVLEQLRKEFSHAVTPANSKDGETLLQGMQQAAAASRNPLHGGRAPGARGVAMPLIAFIECLVAAEVAALRGPEEDPANYLPPPPPPPPSPPPPPVEEEAAKELTPSQLGLGDEDGADADADADGAGADDGTGLGDGDEENEADLGDGDEDGADLVDGDGADLDDADANGLGDADENAGEKDEGEGDDDGPFELLSVDEWARLLRRLGDIEAAIDQLSPSSRTGPEYEALQQEKDEIERKIRRLFGVVSHSTNELHEETVAGDMYDVFYQAEQEREADASKFPKREEHDAMALVAFQKANPGVDVVTSPEEFRHFLEIYTHLIAMYKETTRLQGVEGSTVNPMTEDETVGAVQALPHDLQVRMAQATNPFMDTPDEQPLIGLFNALTEPATAADDDGKLDFQLLCEFAASVAGRRSSRSAMRDLETLRRYLGVVPEDPEGRRTSAAFVSLCCGIGEEPEKRSRKVKAFLTSARHNSRLWLYAPLSTYGPAAAVLFCASATGLADATVGRREKEGPESPMSPDGRHFASPLMTRLHDLAEARGEAETETDEDEFRVFSSLLAHALFGVTAVNRCLWETEPREGGEDTGLRLCPGTQIERAWFGEAVVRIADALGCPLATMLECAGAVLAARQEGIATVRGAHHNPIAQGTPEKTEVAPAGDAEGEGEGEAPVVAEVDEEAAAVDRAFVEMAAIDHDMGLHGSCVLLEDLVYVCVFNAARQYFGDNPFLAGFFNAPFPFDWRAALARMLAALPLDDVDGQLRDFYTFSKGKRTVVIATDLEKAEAHPEGEYFLQAMYNKYKEVTGPIIGTEEEFTGWVRQAVARVTGGKGDGAETICAKDYAGIVEFLAGHLIAYVSHKGTKEGTVAGVAGTVTGLKDDAIRRRYIEELLLFPGDEDSCDEAAREAAAEAARHAFTELQLLEMDERNGDVSLQSAAAWYGDLRVTRLRERQALVSQWGDVAAALPHTTSLEHRRQRREIFRKLREERRQRDGYDGDGYITADALIDECLSFLPFKGDASPLPSFPDLRAWMRGCIRCANEIVGRPDLADDELHRRDLRFFFAVMYLHLTAYGTLAETKAEVTVTQALLQEGILDAEDCPDPDGVLRDAVHRYLHDDIAAHPEVAAELESDECLARFATASPDGSLDAEGLTDHITRTVLRHAHMLFLLAQAKNREENESRVIAIYEEEMRFGRHSPNSCRIRYNEVDSDPIATYWELLRHLLPAGDSERARMRRRKLWGKIDIRGRGFVTLADLNRGLHDVLCLHDYREDIAPVLFRAFFATVDMFADKADVVLVTAGSERILTPRQFGPFLWYVYSYMEQYFMFDVLTCSGALNKKLRIMPSAVDPSLGYPTEGGEDEDVAAADPSDAIMCAAEAPYAIMYDSAGVPKSVTLDQFRIAHRLLRHWGIHVRDADVSFADINRRTRETGEMNFTGFAIWASEANLHPEGYGHGFSEDDEQAVRIEDRIWADTSLKLTAETA